MKSFLVPQIYLLFCVSNSWTQYPAYLQPTMQGNFYQTQFMEFPLVLPQRYPMKSPEYHAGAMVSYYDNYNDYGQTEDCVCPCSQCVRPKSCCLQYCLSCNQQPQPNVVVMPYPYPLIVGTDSSTTPTTSTSDNTQTTTTAAAATTTTSTPPPPPVYNIPLESRCIHRNGTLDTRRILNDIDIGDIIMKTPETRERDFKYILTTLRKTKSDWRPKYGIVPIPDRLAETLMSELRTMKDINSL